MTPALTTDVLVVGSGPAGASAALFLSSLGVDNIVITKYRWTANTPRAHITNQRTDGDLPRPRHRGRGHRRGDAARAHGRHRVLHQPRRRGDRPAPHLGHAPGARRPTTRWPARRRTCDLPQTCSSRSSSAHAARARQPDPLRHRVPRRSSRTTTASTATVRDRLGGRDVRDPREVPDRRRRRPQRRWRRTSGCRSRGRWTSPASMNIVLQGRPDALRRAPPERPVLGAADRARTSAASASASCAWCARGTSG